MTWWCCIAVRWRNPLGGPPMNKPSTSYLPTHDGHRGAIIKWPVNCHQAFDKGV
ncbi:hypothetical protein D3C84_1294970 [compost metagenome]